MQNHVTNEFSQEPRTWNNKLFTTYYTQCKKPRTRRY